VVRGTSWSGHHSEIVRITDDELADRRPEILVRELLMHRDKPKAPVQTTRMLFLADPKDPRHPIRGLREQTELCVIRNRNQDRSSLMRNAAAPDPTCGVVNKVEFHQLSH
jgi:hypothetical protein